MLLLHAVQWYTLFSWHGGESDAFNRNKDSVGCGRLFGIVPYTVILIDVLLCTTTSCAGGLAGFCSWEQNGLACVFVVSHSIGTLKRASPCKLHVVMIHTCRVYLNMDTNRSTTCEGYSDDRDPGCRQTHARALPREWLAYVSSELHFTSAEDSGKKQNIISGTRSILHTQYMGEHRKNTTTLNSSTGVDSRPPLPLKEKKTMRTGPLLLQDRPFYAHFPKHAGTPLLAPLHDPRPPPRRKWSPPSLQHYSRPHPPPQPVKAQAPPLPHPLEPVPPVPSEPAPSAVVAAAAAAAGAAVAAPAFRAAPAVQRSYPSWP